MKTKMIFGVLAFVIFVAMIMGLMKQPHDMIEIAKLDSLPEGTWQGTITFPDWKGYVDDTLAMNSMYSFDGAKGQGSVYLSVKPEVESFDLFINNTRINTKEMKDGDYQIDIASIAKNGTNTIQISNMIPNRLLLILQL